MQEIFRIKNALLIEPPFLNYIKFRNLHDYVITTNMEYYRLDVLYIFLFVVVSRKFLVNA